MRMGCAVLADRTEEHADERAVSPGSHDEQVCSLGCLDQRLGGMSVREDRGDGYFRMALHDSGHGCLEFLSLFTNRVRLVKHRGSGIGHRPIPGHDHF